MKDKKTIIMLGVLVAVIIGVIALNMVGNKKKEDKSTTSTTPVIASESYETIIETSSLVYPTTNENFRYSIYSKYIAIDEYIGQNPDVIIPSEIDGVPVIKITDDAFKESGIHTITILEGVMDIGKDAFLDAKSLTSVTLPNSLQYIEDKAFKGCEALATIKCGNGLVSCGYNAFRDCTSLSDITLPNSLTTLGENCFTGCSSLISINIPYNVTTIPDYCFSKCTNLSSVNIEKGSANTTTPSSNKDAVTRSISSAAFYKCTALSLIWIPDDIIEINRDAFDVEDNHITICGYSASAAATYASENRIDFTVIDKNKFYGIAEKCNKIQLGLSHISKKYIEDGVVTPDHIDAYKNELSVYGQFLTDKNIISSYGFNDNIMVMTISSDRIYTYVIPTKK